MKRGILVLFAAASTVAALAAGTPQRAFIDAWHGRSVTLRATLYSLVYNERGKLGTTRNGRQEALVVVTVSQGAYLQFDGRQGRDDVREIDPGRVVPAVNAAYEADALDVRAYRKLEATTVRRFDPGAALVVSDVRVDRDQVRLELSRPGEDEPATGLRVRWTGPFSKAFDERATVEGLIQQFVRPAQP